MTTVTAGVKDLEQIAKSAAHLVAAMHDTTHGVKLESLDPEVRDSLMALRAQMREVEFLEPYELGGGKLGIV